MVLMGFIEALSNYDPLRLAVYTPATIPLSERKKIGEVIFSELKGGQTPKAPKWFRNIFKELTNNAVFAEIQELCRGNPVLSAQITAEIIRSLDKTIDELFEGLRSWLKKEEETGDEKSKPPTPPLPIFGGDSSDFGTDSSGGSVPDASDSAQSSEGSVESGSVSIDDVSDEATAGSESDEGMKSRIEKILEDLKLLPILQPIEDCSELPSDTKHDAQSQLETSIEEALEEILSKAKEWESLYDLLTAILPGLGWDYSPGFLKHNLLSKYMELSKLLDKIPQLKELANRLGRYHSLMGERIWDPTAHGKSEVFSVERSGDIERILPSELVQLGYSATKYLFYSKLADKSLLTYQLRGEGWTQPEKQERGPVVICIDTSGSMRGFPESIAKAVSLAVAKEANSQSRSVHMILFGSRNETRDFTFDKSENAVDSLLGLLNLTFGGGTDFDSALKVALEKLEEEEFRLADVLFVTDGYGEIAQLNDEIEKIKREQGTRFFSLLIESEDVDAIRSISDETWILNLTHGARPSLSTLRSKIHTPD